MHRMSIKVIGSDSLPEIYSLALKLFMRRVQNLNMTVFEMFVVVVVVVEFKISVCLLLQVLDAMEGNLLSQRQFCP
jgi:NADH:ubiquinone oxidoreductase subunit K